MVYAGNNTVAPCKFPRHTRLRFFLLLAARHERSLSHADALLASIWEVVAGCAATLSVPTPAYWILAAKTILDVNSAEHASAVVAHPASAQSATFDYRAGSLDHCQPQRPAVPGRRHMYHVLTPARYRQHLKLVQLERRKSG